MSSDSSNQLKYMTCVLKIIINENEMTTEVTVEYWLRGWQFFNYLYSITLRDGE